MLASFDLFDAAGAGVALFEGVRFHAIRLVRDASLIHHAFRQIVVPFEPAGHAAPVAL